MGTRSVVSSKSAPSDSVHRSVVKNNTSPTKPVTHQQPKTTLSPLRQSRPPDLYLSVMICAPISQHVGLTTFLSALGMQTTFNIGGTLVGIRTWVSPAANSNAQLPPAQALEDTKGVIVLYDITNYSTFEQAEEWTNRLNSGLSNLPKILVGNKCDLEGQRNVRTAEAQMLADGNNFIDFYEVSSVTGLNVRDVAESLAWEMVKRQAVQHNTTTNTNYNQVSSHNNSNSHDTGFFNDSNDSNDNDSYNSDADADAEHIPEAPLQQQAQTQSQPQQVEESQLSQYQDQPSQTHSQPQSHDQQPQPQPQSQPQTQPQAQQQAQPQAQQTQLSQLSQIQNQATQPQSAQQQHQQLPPIKTTSKIQTKDAESEIFG